MSINPFANLSDVQRSLVRMVMQITGCFSCTCLITHSGRNCNSYGCRMGPKGCDNLREADKALAEILREEQEKLKGDKTCPNPPSAS